MTLSDLIAKLVEPRVRIWLAENRYWHVQRKTWYWPFWCWTGSLFSDEDAAWDCALRLKHAPPVRRPAREVP